MNLQGNRSRTPKAGVAFAQADLPGRVAASRRGRGIGRLLLRRYSVEWTKAPSQWQAFDNINVRPFLPLLKVPTIVFHSDRDKIAPPPEGRILAAEIPGARFVPLPTANHLLLAAEPAWRIFRDELAAFLASTPVSAGAEPLRKAVPGLQ